MSRATDIADQTEFRESVLGSGGKDSVRNTPQAALDTFARFVKAHPDKCRTLDAARRSFARMRSDLNRLLDQCVGLESTHRTAIQAGAPAEKGKPAKPRMLRVEPTLRKKR